VKGKGALAILLLVIVIIYFAYFFKNGKKGPGRRRNFPF